MDFPNVTTELSHPEELETPAAVHVRPFRPDIAPLWDRFVVAQPHGTLFHLTAWKRAIEATFSYAPRYVYAERAGEITGVAPVFFISNWIEGRCLLSIPFAVYGGICATDAESESALLEHLRKLAHSERVEHFELRCRTHEDIPGFSRNSLYVTFVTSIARDPEANLKRLPRDTRYMIRKAIKAGLRSERGAAQIDQFYRLFTLSMRRLGTPVLPRSFFSTLLSEFKGAADLLMVYAGSKPIAGVFYFIYGNTVVPYYAGCDDDATALAANNFMYWELLKYSAETGMQEFDFGRSKRGTGSFLFKSQWNMRVQPLDYQVLLVRRKKVPNFSPVNPKFELAARLWRRLPLPIATWLGPHVVRWFP